MKTFIVIVVCLILIGFITIGFEPTIELVRQIAETIWSFIKSIGVFFQTLIKIYNAFA